MRITQENSKSMQEVNALSQPVSFSREEEDDEGKIAYGSRIVAQ